MTRSARAWWLDVSNVSPRLRYAGDFQSDSDLVSDVHPCYDIKMKDS